MLGILSNASTGKPLILLTLAFVVNQIFAKNVMQSSYFWPPTDPLGSSFLKCNKLLPCLCPVAMWQKRSRTAFRLTPITFLFSCTKFYWELMTVSSIHYSCMVIYVNYC